MIPTTSTCPTCGGCTSSANCATGQCCNGGTCGTCPSGGPPPPPPPPPPPTGGCPNPTQHSCSAYNVGNVATCSYRYPRAARYNPATGDDIEGVIGGCYDNCSGTYCGPSTDTVPTACGGPIRENPSNCGACGLQTFNTSCIGGTTCGYFPAASDTICRCTDSTWSCASPYNGNEVSNCGTTRANAACGVRFITAGGASIHSVGAITGLYDSNYPAGQYFNPSQYGVVSSNADISLSGAKINLKAWKVTNYASQLTRYDHDYFWSRLKDKVATTLNANSISSGDLQASGTDPFVMAIHPISGNTVTFNTPINVNGGKLLVVFVNATNGTPVNLTVGDKVSVGGGGFIIWIVSGNVNVASSVSQADGYYIATGSYSDGSGSTQLNDSGGVAAYGGINLGRVNSTTTQPSEAFSYNNDITKFAPLIGEALYNWSEIVP